MPPRVPRDRDDDLSDPWSGRTTSWTGRNRRSFGLGERLRRFFAHNDNPLAWSVPVGRIIGISIRLHILYILWMAVEVGVAAAKGGPSFGLRLGVVGCLLLLVLLHEFGHCLACRRVGGSADEILLWPLGGLASCRPPHHWKASLITTLGGPGVNVALFPVLGGALYLATGSWTTIFFNPFHPDAAFSEAFTVAQYSGALLWSAYFANAVLLGFNILLPMFPLDGGRILQELLWRRMGYRASMGVATTVGLFVAIGVGLAALMTQAMTVFAICVFAGLVCVQERTRLKWLDTAAIEPEAETPWASSLRDQHDDLDPDRERAIAKQERAAARAAKEARERDAELDRLLDKIKRHGMASLTPAEKKWLEQDTSRRRSVG
jgi:stage IV sporulation protein FB